MNSASSGWVYDAWLASACMPSHMLIKLLEQYQDAEACFSAFTKHDPFIRETIPPRFFRILDMNSSDSVLSVYRRKIEKNGIHVIEFNDGSYPDRLKEIDEPPAILFYQGNPDCLESRTAAIVGSRAASYSGLKAAEKLAEELSRHGITIISGMACGIDTAAHTGCLKGRSPTIAVTGCGLDRVYPADNFVLRDRILEQNGLILSEYAPGEKPAGWHFPVRNRIISGLAEAMILMEAKIRSGSMTSVQHALNQGKDLFVYPGEPDSEMFSGNHQLLREGGIYFTSAEDILEDMHWLDNPSSVRQNSDCSSAASASGPEEQTVAEALKPGARSFEQLLNLTALPPAVLMSTLTIMQIKGMIESLPGKQYQIRH